MKSRRGFHFIPVINAMARREQPAGGQLPDELDPAVVRNAAIASIAISTPEIGMII
ncbi:MULTISPECIES: hypothetical protein [Bacillus]|uniref:hypothetical protein n=1 Tax=Bacillus TaxID=1386 RepID=UPI0015829EBF|nr:hypothetical protein [Bacillus glycinifermentans]MBU8785910.1 hypothetical protein [Bacillus glycinifermentans]